jgi:hypothetical protein
MHNFNRPGYSFMKTVGHKRSIGLLIFDIFLVVLMLAVGIAIVRGWATCDGAYVRTAFWYACIPVAP